MPRRDMKVSSFTPHQKDIIKQFYPQSRYNLADIAKKMGLSNPDDGTQLKYISHVAIHELGLRPRKRHTNYKETVSNLEAELAAAKAQIATLTKAGRPIWHAEINGLWYGDLLVAELADAEYAPVLDLISDKLNESKVDLSVYMVSGG